MRRGTLIAIEGSDGTGKTTQMDILRRRMVAQGKPFVPYDFPRKSGDPVADLIGGFLRGQYGDVAPEFLALAFALDRLDLRDEMREALGVGCVVLCDRYTESNVALQSAKIADPARREALKRMLRHVERDVMGLPKPDLQVVMTADDAYFEAGRHLERAHDERRAYARGGHDVHEADFGLQVRANQYFRSLPADAQTRHVDVLDAQGRRRGKEDVAAEVERLVAEATQAAARG